MGRRYYIMNKNCTGCARRRETIKTTWQRIVTMPWHMNPEWLPSHERDNWIMHRDRALMTMGIKGKAALRRYQHGFIGALTSGIGAAAGAATDCTFTGKSVV